MKENTLHDFGIMTFNKSRMKKRLPYPVYLKWKNAIRNEEDLDKDTADTIAHAMKEWAIENGATHYSHWFQPLNGLTAMKHESFIDRTQELDPIIRFSGKELIKGEPDASSFPNGGMRSTFEARGYTYWDCTANSFIIDNVMYIPTIFVSFTGEKLDKRSPLLSSMNLVSEQGRRITNLFETEDHTYRLKSKVGLEQEFFLIDRELYNKRSDLKNCGRTLIGARPPKGQELEDHYFGAIPQRVMDFYKDVNENLWNLGIYAKTEHNEVAPGQFEVAVLFENTNVSIDNNQLCMTILKRVALKHGLVCLLHEKPYANVNGSGKHNNYSLATNYGFNCFDPGDNPEENIIFQLFVVAMMEVTNKYANLLRVASSSPGNDYRLGGQEAPPAIISMFLGQDLEELFKSLVYDNYEPSLKLAKIKVNNLAYVPRDNSDRNRTSPFAFTGNKFEFRMLGSSRSAADVNIVLNTAMGTVLKSIAEELEPYSESPELKEKAMEIVKRKYIENERILFGGDNYSKEWIAEAEKRGLANHVTYFDALKASYDKELVSIFPENEVLSINELKAMYEVGMEEVVNTHTLEARALMAMVTKDVVPAAMAEIESINKLLQCIENSALRNKLNKLNVLLEELLELDEKLKERYDRAYEFNTVEEEAEFLQRDVAPMFMDIRRVSDNIEVLVSRENWKIPTYEDIFNSLV